MSKTTNSLRKYRAEIKADPKVATENTGFFIIWLADEVDRLRRALESVLRTADQALDPENFEI